MPGVNGNSADAQSRVGRTVKGKWVIDGLLGVGGMGAVYAARHQNNDGRVALKFLRRDLSALPEHRNRFLREGYAANRVGHRGVVRVYDDDSDEDGSVFLVMELLQGETVAQRAKHCGGVLSVDETLDIADQLLDVLAAAHDRGVLHRDIKPENLFLTETGELRVLDFGVARLRESIAGSSDTEAGTLLGTPAFISPEQARGDVDALEPRSDLWAVGATMFTLLSGELVHAAKTRSAQVALSMTTPARSLCTVAPELPERLIRVVDRALEFSPDQRWPDARSMQNEVRMLRASTGEPSMSVRPASHSEETGASSQRTLSNTSASDLTPLVSPSARAGTRRIPAPAWLAIGFVATMAALALTFTRASAPTRPDGNPTRAAASAPKRLETAPAARTEPVPSADPERAPEAERSVDQRRAAMSVSHPSGTPQKRSVKTRAVSAPPPASSSAEAALGAAPRDPLDRRY